MTFIITSEHCLW